MIRSVFLICVANAPPSHISSSRFLFISGTQASIFYSSEAYPTRISVPFAQSLKQISGALVPLCITAATFTSAFTTVVDREYHGFTYPSWVAGRVRGVGVRVRKFVPSPYPYPRDVYVGFDRFFPRVFPIWIGQRGVTALPK